MLLVLNIGCTTAPGASDQGVNELEQASSVSLALPVWSPAGNQLAASYYSDSDYKSKIYILDLETHRNSVPIIIDGEANAQSWSPNGDSIAVAISGSNKFSEGIWVFNLMDSSKYYVAPGEAAAWSPDGKKMAIFSCTQLSDGISTIATLRVIDLLSKVEAVLFNRESCLKLAYLSWSPDNQSIVFSFSKDSDTNKHLDRMFVIDLTTKRIDPILTEGNWSPSFSPTGERIVFVKDYSLALTDKSGACIVDIKNPGVQIIGDISWSPDGSKWAVSGVGKVYIIDLDEFMGQDFLQNTSICK
jgi:Tol biopolymer transport system component